MKKYHFLPNFLNSAFATALASICVVLQTRKTFQWQSEPVTASVWPPGTTWRMLFSMETFAIASASAELTLPSRKLTWSRSISLRAFCTAVPASPLVESSTEARPTAEDAALGVDLVERELAADQFVLAERGVGAGQRIVEADLDRLVGERFHHKRAGNLHGADRKTGLEQRAAFEGTADKVNADEILGHSSPWRYF